MASDLPSNMGGLLTTGSLISQIYGHMPMSFFPEQTPLSVSYRMFIYLITQVDKCAYLEEATNSKSRSELPSRKQTQQGRLRATKRWSSLTSFCCTSMKPHIMGTSDSGQSTNQLNWVTPQLGAPQLVHLTSINRRCLQCFSGLFNRIL